MKKLLKLFFFKSFVEHGLAIPACNFLWGLLFFWGVQLCEAFLGIHPHFDLFKSLFSLNPYPNLRNIARVGVPISCFILAWRRSISRVLCVVRLGIGRRSSFILITMLLSFRRGVLDL